MLKVIDDGIQITLMGKNKNPLFFIPLVLMILSVVVAIIAITMPIRITIGSMFVFAVLVFAFNVYKSKLQTHDFIHHGSLTVKKHAFITNGHAVKLSDNATIELIDQTLLITDMGRVWHLSGFENTKELQVTKSVLEGQALQKNERAIRLL